MSTEVLGVRIDSYERPVAVAKVRSFLADAAQHMIVTPNPEMLVAAYADDHFREILNTADLNICDGRGIQLFAKEPIIRITGVDFMKEVCDLAAKEEKSIYLLGSGDQDVIDRLEEVLQQKFPSIKIAGSHVGLPIDIKENKLQYHSDTNDEIVEDIIMTAPDILFVAFGHVKQEKWMHEQLPNLPSVKVIMGVGGSFDFLAGKAKRAPSLFRTLGLEWLWRFIRQPWRWKRMVNALIVFPYLALFKK